MAFRAVGQGIQSSRLGPHKLSHFAIGFGKWKTTTSDETHFCPAGTFHVGHISINHPHKNWLLPSAASFTSKKFVKALVIQGRTASLCPRDFICQKTVWQIGGLKIEDDIRHPGMDAPRIPHGTNVQDPETGPVETNPPDESNEGTAISCGQSQVLNARNAGLLPCVPPSGTQRYVLANGDHSWHTTHPYCKDRTPRPWLQH